MTTPTSIAAIAQQLGCNGRRLDKWAKQIQLPARQKKHPSPGPAEAFRESASALGRGYRNRRLLVDKLRAFGYNGTLKAVGKIVSPWRQGNVDFERTATDVSSAALPPPVLTDPT